MDGKSVFYGSDQLPLRADQLKTQWSFAWDDERVFWGDFEVPLHGASFRILARRAVGSALPMRTRRSSSAVIFAHARRG
jgi:hypothetical protein